jgi:chorismate binding enzyme
VQHCCQHHACVRPGQRFTSGEATHCSRYTLRLLAWQVSALKVSALRAPGVLGAVGVQLSAPLCPWSCRGLAVRGSHYTDGACRAADAAGPFGWVNAGAAEFAVAIRSALLHPEAWPSPEDRQTAPARAPAPAAVEPETAVRRRVSLYAGVGIVRGSDVNSEWQVRGRLG